LLVASCGGKSVSVADDDGGAGGTSGGSTSNGGGANRSSSSSGGASPGAAPNAGTGGGQAGTGGVAGAPSVEMLEELCSSICEQGVAASCDGFESDECAATCHPYAVLASQSAVCGRMTYDYFACIDALPDICSFDSSCGDYGESALKCLSNYCQGHPGTGPCDL
jgi:hypothetical protein